MDFKFISRKLFFLAFILLYSSILFAQSTEVSGTITDALTKKKLQFVTVSFTGTTIGVNTNNHGKYTISSPKPASQVKVSFLGYKDAFFAIKPGATQVLNVRLV